MTRHPPGSGPAGRPRVEIRQLPLPALRALADGDLAAAEAAAGVRCTAYFVDPQWRGVWRRRTVQITADPVAAQWVAGAVLDLDRGIAVGRAGFHGPPDAAGLVEVGYAVDPPERRRGYARAALEALLARARAEPGVRTVRASISPDNVASRRLVEQYGFVVVGEQWDDEDGLEVVLEVPAGQ